MPIFIRHHHLLYNLLNVLIGGFHCTIHLLSIRRRVVVLDLDLCVEFRDYSFVDIGTIVCDNPFGDAILTDKVMLYGLSHNLLGNRGK